MASDTVVAILGIAAVAGPIVTAYLGWRFQTKQARETRENELQSEQMRRAHELRRDRQGKYFEFRIAEYRERQKACEALLASIRQASIASSALAHVLEQDKKPQSAASAEARDAEDAAYYESRDLVNRYSDEALRLLGTDDNATKVLDAYYSLPLDELLRAPADPTIRQTWNEGCRQPQQAVFDYLRELKGSLVADDLTGSL